MLNVRDAISEIRSRIHDRDGVTFDDDEILEVMDSRMKHLMTRLRTHGDNRGYDYVEIATSALTQIETNEYTYTLPEWMTDIQLIELANSGSRPKAVPRVSLEEKEAWSASYTWHFGRRGTVHLRGSVGGFTTVRVWFVRTPPPLFYSTLTGASTTLTAVLGTTTSSRYKARTGLYDAFSFEVTSDSGGAANVGQVRRCSSFTSGVLTFDEAWPAALSATSQLAMCVPLDNEFHEFFTTLCAKKLFERQGSADDIAIVNQDLEYLQVEFESGIARRSSGEPPRLISSRRYW